MIDRLALVGVGLIGASAGLAAKGRGLAREVVGFSRRKETLEAAQEVGAVDRCEGDLGRAVEGADFVLIATPVGTIADLAQQVARSPLTDGAVITDAGSVKAPIVEQVEADERAAPLFVGGHPVAGTEKSGPRAAFARLFEGRRCILTPTARTDASRLARVGAFWQALGMSVEKLDPLEHDEVLAMISHLPHMVAYALVGAVSDYDEKDRRALAFAAGGFKDFTRIAASSPKMWRQIVELNAPATIEALGRFSTVLDEIRRTLSEGRFDDLEGLLEKAARARRLLNAGEEGA